jgi:hypothetical protein
MTGNRLLDVYPASIVKVVGGMTAFALLVRLMVMPFAGAGPEIVAINLAPLPPATLVGFKLSPVMVGGSTVTDAVLVLSL